MPVPQEKMFFVGWAGEPVLVIFARGLLSNEEGLKSLLQTVRNLLIWTGRADDADFVAKT